MENYADFTFYKDEYKGSLSNDLFNSFIVKASRDIDRNINRKIDSTYLSTISAADLYKIKYTACELVDYNSNFGGNTNNGKATSIGIDGVSINRSSKSEKTMLRAKTQILADLPQELTRWL